ncbi:MAG: glycogen phosphorylase [Desulfobacterales bacterium RIFOXYA12_FULL_46_15]|nr:MAG: glycogen phosphorylase [Desulfobacterales bacterium RIFOXYA12_FULL_46_15]
MAYFDFTSFEISLNHYIRYALGKKSEEASSYDMMKAVSMAVGRYLMDVNFETYQRYIERGSKRLYYLSMEFLIGRLLANNLLNLGIYDQCGAFLKKKGIDLEALLEKERNPALGNGGLGRLAACFLDSLATLDMPGFGYGINYDFGLFKQLIVNGYQREKPDYWPNRSSPWLIQRSGNKCMIPVYGRIEDTKDRDGGYNPMWTDWKLIIGRPHDILISGYGGRTANRLRLYSAWASEDFDMQIFNEGDYFNAVDEKIKSETISKILYPSDSKEAGKELRLVQEYFLVACSVRDIIRIHQKYNNGIESLHEKVAIQLNDTHPALTVAELMRVLVDENGIDWDKAWDITTRTLAYTNHTLLPEALETWPLPIIKKVIPRHLQIIYEINRRFIDSVKAKCGENCQDLISRMSIIGEGNPKQVRMANLAIIGSHSVNGVAKIHTELVKTKLVPEFYSFFPEKFNNKTNGVTPRRWIVSCNPGLTKLICEVIGRRWITDLERIREIESYADDQSFLDRFVQVKKENKLKLSDIIHKTVFETVDPESIFDIQAKRIHEYKRQLLNVMNIIHTYFLIKEDNADIGHPRTFIFSGKAAPGYHTAKLIIKLIHSVAGVINKDPKVNQMLKIVFLPDYRVSLAERIIPAADVSEQISTAGMEASGTGNMKFAMNGAITVGTLDGANIEIYEQVGRGNIYIFGLKVDQIENLRLNYNPRDYTAKDIRLKRVIDALGSDMFCKKEPRLFLPLYHKLIDEGDFYLHCADFSSYVNAQELIGKDFLQSRAWAVKSLLNTARTGLFSSDRTIKEYAKEIWNIKSEI